LMRQHRYVCLLISSHPVVKPPNNPIATDDVCYHLTLDVTEGLALYQTFTLTF